MSSKYVCLKYGSTQVDDGKNYLASFIGVCLFIIGLTILIIISCCVQRAVVDWSTYSPWIVRTLRKSS